MRSERFDQISRLFAQRRLSRRAALQQSGFGLAAAIGAAGLARSAAAQEATPLPEPDTIHPNAGADESATLFAQPFTSGTWTPKSDDESTYLLTLNGATQTGYFSESPHRMFGFVPTPMILQSIGFTPENPPEAALVTHSTPEDRDALIITLFNPAYDDGSATLTYEAQIVTDYDGTGLAHVANFQTDFEIDEQFNQGGLFVEGCQPRPVYCYIRQEDGSRGPTVGATGFMPHCFDSASYQCVPCRDPATICAAVFPDLCIDRRISPPRSRCAAVGVPTGPTSEM